MLRNTLNLHRLERPTATDFTTTSTLIRHMEINLHIPAHVIYSDGYSLETSDRTPSAVIAGSDTESGYREGSGSEARFDYIYRFSQIQTDKSVVVAMSDDF